MASAIRIAVLANASQTVGEFGKVEGSAKRMARVVSGAGSVFKGVLGAGLVAGGVAAAVRGVERFSGVLKDSISEARESQQVGAVTAQIIKATGGAAKISAGQVGELTTAISNKTGVDDEAVQKGANLLLTFKNVRNEVGQGNDVFNRATAAAVDLSKAGFGSIEGGSKMLGKALNDPIKGITALSRAGVTFSDQQKKQIKTLVASGHTLQAQKIILGEVEHRVGGVAAANATAGEKATTLANNLKEQFGTALLPALDGVLGYFNTKLGPAIGRGITAITPALESIGKGIGPVLTRLGGIVGPALTRVLGLVKPFVLVLGSLLSGKGLPAGTPPWLSALVSAAQQVGPVVAQIAQAVGPVLASLGPALGQAFGVLAPIIGQLAGAFGTLGPQLSPVGILLQALTPVLPVVVAAFVQLATAVGGGLTSVLAVLVPALAQIGAVITSTLVPVLSQLIVTMLPPLVAVVTAVIGVVTQLLPVLLPIVTTLVSTLLPVVAQLVTALLPVFATVIGAVAQVLIALAPVLAQVGQLLATVFAQAMPAIVAAVGVITKVISALLPVIKVVFTTVVGIISGALKIVSGVIQVVMGVISGNWSQVWNGIKTIVAGVWGIIKSIVSGAINQVKAVLGSTFAAIGANVRSAWTAISSTVSKGVTSVIGYVKSLPGKAKTALSNAATVLIDAGKDLVRGLVRGIQNGVGWVIDAARGVAQAAIRAAKSALGIASPSKVFTEIGKYVGQGFVQGLQGTEEDARGAVEKMVGLLSQAAAEQAKLEAKYRAKARRESGKDRRRDLAAATKAARLSKAAKMSEAQVSALGVQASAVAQRRAVFAEALTEAQDKLNTLTQQYVSYAQAASDAAQNFASVTSIALADDGPQTAAGLIDGLRSRLLAISDYSTKLQQLAARGLNKDTYDELLQAGVQGGSAYVNALFNASDSEISQVNALQLTIKSTADQLGDKSADYLYGAGVRAQQGLVDGLTAESSALAAAATQIANTIAAAIKAALKIKSPSRVFQEIGEQTVAGLRIGLGPASVVQAGRTLASALTGGFGEPALAVGVTGTSGGNTYNLNVSVPLGTTRSEVGREIVDAIKEYERTNGKR